MKKERLENENLLLHKAINQLIGGDGILVYIYSGKDKMPFLIIPFNANTANTIRVAADSLDISLGDYIKKAILSHVDIASGTVLSD